MDYIKILNCAIDVILPPACPVCGQPKHYYNGRRIDICRSCQDAVSYVKEPVCLKCGKPVKSDEQEFCTDCSRHEHSYDQAAAVYEYSSAVKNSIYRFKYHNKREYADVYAKEMMKACGHMIKMWNPDAIIPVPVHSSRLRSRGYNQAQLIAVQLGRLSGIPVDDVSLLRVKKTAPMKELGNSERIKNLQNAFQVNGKVVIYSKVLIVDDIYTTGATFDACAKALKDAGVQRVYGISLCVGDGF